MSRYLGLDPATRVFGVCGIEVNEGRLDLYMDYLIKAPEHFVTTQRNQYMSHMTAALISLDKPDMVISEAPWGGGGWSTQAFKELIGSIKSSYWDTIIWQGVSEARRAVLGDGYGGAKKRVTAEWLLQYDWNISSKRRMQELFDKASKDTDDGYDELDAILHVLCYLVANKLIEPKHKEPKKPKKVKKIKEPV